MLKVYTSGIARNNTGDGACSVVVYFDDAPFIQHEAPVEFSHRFTATTNMQMLQMALIGAVICLKGQPATIYTPNTWSADAVGGMERARAKQQRGESLSRNDELWLQLADALATANNVSIAHLDDDKHPGAKRALKIARAALGGEDERRG